MKYNFWNNKRVLVTGHEGFLGSWLSSVLVNKKAKVIGLDIVYKRPKSILRENRKYLTGIKGDVSDLRTVRKVINSYKPEFIFHLAAEAIVGRANKNPLRTFKSNIEGTWNILESCRGKSFITGIIIASSDKAYGPQKNLPYTEDMSVKGAYPYDVSKSCTDLIATTYHRTYNSPVCITRCGNIYGPGDLNFSRIVPDAIRSILRNKRFVIRSDGKFTRDYIYVEDVASGYMILAEKMKRLKLYGEAFNFSNEKPLTVLKLFKEIAHVSRINTFPPKVLNKAKYEIKHQYLSSKKAKSILGWLPVYSLKKGLKETLAWYDKNI